MPSPDEQDPRARDQAQQLYADARRHVDHNEPEAAYQLLEQLPFDALDAPSLLPARALALQLAVHGSAYSDAMAHAAAALTITAEEPLIYHLMGQAFWASGDTRTGAEAVVLAAELLQTLEAANQPTRLPVDAPSIYYMAGEACQHYEQYEAALAFFQQAGRHAPAHETIARSITEVQAALDAPDQAA